MNSLVRLIESSPLLNRLLAQVQCQCHVATLLQAKQTFKLNISYKIFTSRWTCLTWNVRHQHESQMTLNIHIHTQHVIMSNEPPAADPEYHILNSNFNELYSASIPDRHAQLMKQISSQHI